MSFSTFFVLLLLLHSSQAMERYIAHRGTSEDFDEYGIDGDLDYIDTQVYAQVEGSSVDGDDWKFPGFQDDFNWEVWTAESAPNPFRVRIKFPKAINGFSAAFGTQLTLRSTTPFAGFLNGASSLLSTQNLDSTSDWHLFRYFMRFDLAPNFDGECTLLNSVNENVLALEFSNVSFPTDLTAKAGFLATLGVTENLCLINLDSLTGRNFHTKVNDIGGTYGRDVHFKSFSQVSVLGQESNLFPSNGPFFLSEASSGLAYTASVLPGCSQSPLQACVESSDLPSFVGASSSPTCSSCCSDGCTDACFQCNTVGLPRLPVYPSRNLVSSPCGTLGELKAPSAIWAEECPSAAATSIQASLTDDIAESHSTSLESSQSERQQQSSRSLSNELESGSLADSLTSSPGDSIIGTEDDSFLLIIILVILGGILLLCLIFLCLFLVNRRRGDRAPSPSPRFSVRREGRSMQSIRGRSGSLKRTRSISRGIRRNTGTSSASSENVYERLPDLGGLTMNIGAASGPQGYTLPPPPTLGPGLGAYAEGDYANLPNVLNLGRGGLGDYTSLPADAQQGGGAPNDYADVPQDVQMKRRKGTSSSSRK